MASVVLCSECSVLGPSSSPVQCSLLQPRPYRLSSQTCVLRRRTGKQSSTSTLQLTEPYLTQTAKQPYFLRTRAMDHILTKGLERVKKRLGRMVRDPKKYGCPPCIYQTRSKLPVLPATGNSHWSNPDAICHQMSITPHQKDVAAVSVSLESQILVGNWTMLT